MSKLSQTFIILVFGFVFPLIVNAQNVQDADDLASDVPPHRTCGTILYHQYLRENFPDETLSLEEMEAQLQKAIASGKVRTYDKTSNTITIPVVVHVVYKNLSDSLSLIRILSNINSLNQDYNMENADTSLIPAYYKSRAGSIGIRFVLANLDPNLQPTNGVTYTKTNIVQFSMDNTIKTTSLGGHDIWDCNNYLNIWTGRLSGGLLGYSPIPGGLAAYDGVVIDSKYFGAWGSGSSSPYNRGRTATHEIGHWLGLSHVWGDMTCGSDGIDDTPTSEKENFDCPGYPSITCNNGANNNTEGGDMYMNFMDYTDDACMNMFTEGQKAKIYTTISEFRPNITSSYALTGISRELDSELAVQVYPNPSNSGIFNFNLDYRIRENATVRVINALGGEVMQVQNESSVLDLSQQTSGIYFLLVNTPDGKRFTRKLIVK